MRVKNRVNDLRESLVPNHRLWVSLISVDRYGLAANVIVHRRPNTQCQSNLHVGLSLHPEPQILLFLRWLGNWPAWLVSIVTDSLEWCWVKIWWPSLLNTNLSIFIDEKDVTFTLCITIFKQFVCDLFWPYESYNYSYQFILQSFFITHEKSESGCLCVFLLFLKILSLQSKSKS